MQMNGQLSIAAREVALSEPPSTSDLINFQCHSRGFTLCPIGPIAATCATSNRVDLLRVYLFPLTDRIQRYTLYAEYAFDFLSVISVWWAGIGGWRILKGPLLPIFWYFLA